jgi:hypothetical protein
MSGSYDGREPRPENPPRWLEVVEVLGSVAGFALPVFARLLRFVLWIRRG